MFSEVLHLHSLCLIKIGVNSQCVPCIFGSLWKNVGSWKDGQASYEKLASKLFDSSLYSEMNVYKSYQKINQFLMFT